MERQCLEHILTGLKKATITVVGDFFLDKYLLIDPERDEPSLETGLTAYQVVGTEKYPGAAGTVVKNLLALGVGRVNCVGVIGTDGEGYELCEALKALGANISGLIQSPDRQTGTYTKPVRMIGGVKNEINRLDLKNFTETPKKLREELEERLHEAAACSDALIAVDQVKERNCGVITDDMRDALACLASENPDMVIFGDSRNYIGEYRDIIIKCNGSEVVRIIDPENTNEDPPNELIERCGRRLFSESGRPVFVTLGDKGMMVFDGGHTHVPASPTWGPFDIVGAGDAATTGITAALAMGASPVDAAVVGNTAAAITIQQLGVTGTATPEQILERFDLIGR